MKTSKKIINAIVKKNLQALNALHRMKRAQRKVRGFHEILRDSDVMQGCMTMSFTDIAYNSAKNTRQ